MDTITLSPFALFIHAGLVGKAVMGILLVASIWCWILIVEGIMASLQLRRSLTKASKGDLSGQLQSLVSIGQHALTLQIEGEAVGERRQRLVETMGREGRKLLSLADKGLPTLAVIASISPSSAFWALCGGSCRVLPILRAPRTRALPLWPRALPRHWLRPPMAWLRLSPPRSATPKLAPRSGAARKISMI